eukprot:COSAG03_NODE_2192_length_3024_cov_4.993846_3_plen_167_part_00
MRSPLVLGLHSIPRQVQLRTVLEQTGTERRIDCSADATRCSSAVVRPLASQAQLARSLLRLVSTWAAGILRGHPCVAVWVTGGVTRSHAAARPGRVYLRPAPLKGGRRAGGASRTRAAGSGGEAPGRGGRKNDARGEAAAQHGVQSTATPVAHALMALLRPCLTCN